MTFQEKCAIYKYFLFFINQSYGLQKMYNNYLFYCVLKCVLNF